MNIYSDFEYGMDFSLTSQQKKGGGGTGNRKGNSSNYNRKQKQEQKRRQSENANIYSTKHARLYQQKNLSSSPNKLNTKSKKNTSKRLSKKRSK